MNALVKWKSGLSFTASADSRIEVPLGTDVQVGGSGDGIRPMEMMLMGMAGCTAMDVISILGKKQQKVTGFEVHVKADRLDEHPRVFSKIVIHYLVKGSDLSQAAVERAVELSETKYCSGIAMLRKTADISHEITILEEGS